jgi:predicted nucleic acid-binding Zn ribbon protein
MESVGGNCMAVYVYKCVNDECSEFEKKVDVSKPMSEVSAIELCEKCKHEMVRVYVSFSARTADGFKQ